MKNRRYAIIIFIVVMLGVFLLNPFTFQAFNMPVPDAINQVNQFFDKFTVIRTLDFNNLPINVDNAVETYGVMVGDDEVNDVEVRVIKFRSTEQAEKSFRQYKRSIKSTFKRNLIELHIFSGSYWSVDINRYTYAAWQRLNWLIILKGEDRHSVKTVEKEFKDFLKK